MGSQQPAVAVIIVNWNGRHWLERCLPPLQRQTYQDFEVVVVDNNSEDGSVRWLAEQWPDVRVLAQSENTGFSLANNIGIRATSGKHVVTLNNDTRVEPTWLAELVGAAAGAEVGMVAPCIVQWREPTLLDSAGIEVDRAGIAWQRGWNHPVSALSVAGEVFGPSAAAALYRRTMLEQIGLFDEDFFAYYEDVDLAWRARQAGWRCHYTPEAKVAHWHSATAATMGTRKLYLTSRNKIWTLLKNYAPSLSSLPALLSYDLLATVFQVGRTRDWSALQGRLDALRHRGVALAKRPHPVRSVPLSPLTPPWRLASRLQK